ncbi:TonB-dependent receptor [Telluribacter sp.]|jgi:iron complex outermembrane receptor protein/hemoglobin/transferrin/lactoferrin receptor protein|uniref:TonB-dependent receptor n=1 Tax=Telluribacter sp. TaxID=1978767 RepID=UPI002E13B2E9|nr:TonB-dependent receptor [Telluribacter sp.]
MSKFHLFSFLLIFSFKSYSQTLRGHITDAQTGRPVSGVHVQISNSTLGTTSDRRGNYQVKLPKEANLNVVFSSVGYENHAQEIRGAADQTHDIVLSPATIQLNEEVVVTAQRYQTNQFERPEAITVLTRRDLLQSNVRSTPELLMGQSGLFVQKTNHGGGSPFVRGLTGQQTLLLVDGIRLNNATFRSGPNQYLNTIDPLSLDRIEVVRGGGSVQYGTDAIGGTINVLTQTPQFSERRQLKGTALTRWMSGGMEQSGRLALGVSSQKVAVQGGFSYRNFGDLIAGRSIGRQSPTGYQQWSADVKTRLRLNSKVLLTVAYQNLQQDSVPVFHKVQLENFAVNQFDPQKRMLSYARLEGYGAARWLTSWQVTALAQKTTESRQSRKNGAALTTFEQDEVVTKGALASFTSQPAEYWKIQTGAEWYFDQVKSWRLDTSPFISSPPPIRRGLYPDQASLSNLAFYSLHTFTFSRLTLTGGGRYNTFAIQIPDKDLGSVSIQPSAWVGNAGVSYALRPFLRVIAGVNSTFRAPNIDDLGTLGIVDFRYEVPNSNLRPERGLNKEVGIKLRTPHFSTSLVVYHNQLKDIISRVKTEEVRQGYPVYLKQNMAHAFIRGLEAEAEWLVHQKWIASGYLTHTYGQNISAREPFRRIPPLHGMAGLRYQPTARTWARAEWWSAARQDRLAKGDMEDNRIPAGGTPGWNVINLSAGHSWNRLSISSELQNLFNEAYRTHGSGVAGVGRSLWVSVRYDW